MIAQGQKFGSSPHVTRPKLHCSLFWTILPLQPPSPLLPPTPLCFFFTILDFSFSPSFHSAALIPAFLCPGIMLSTGIFVFVCQARCNRAGIFLWAVFRKFPGLTPKFCIEVTATKTEKTILPASPPRCWRTGHPWQYSLPLGVFIISPCRQTTCQCFATAQILP